MTLTPKPFGTEVVQIQGTKLPFVGLDLFHGSAFGQEVSPPTITDPFISNESDPEPRLIWVALPYVAYKSIQSNTCKLKKTKEKRHIRYLPAAGGSVSKPITRRVVEESRATTTW